MALRSISLCAGIGGIDLGLARWSRTVCYVEREAYAAACLVARMEEAALDPAPVWDDLKTFDGRPWRGRVDLVTGGYPCQPFSLAGARKGDQDPRHLWPDVRRIVEEVQPPLCFFENVPGHVSLGLEDVVRDLEGLGYRVAATLLSAADVGATHKRERLWIMADTDVGRRRGVGLGGGLLDGERPAHGHDADGRYDPAVGNADDEGLEGRDESVRVGSDEWSVGATGPEGFPPGPADADGWAAYSRAGGPQPAVRRGAPGLPDPLDAAFAFRQDRLRALGNAVVPACVAVAFRILLGELFHD